MNDRTGHLYIKMIRRKLLSLGGGLFFFSMMAVYFKQEYWFFPLPLVFLLVSFALFSPLKLNFIIKLTEKTTLYLRKILFSILFFSFITPCSFILRIIRPAVIPLKISPKKASYWEEFNKKEYSSDLNKQY